MKIFFQSLNMALISILLGPPLVWAKDPTIHHQNAGFCASQFAKITHRFYQLPNGIRLYPLTQDTLAESVALLQRVFPYDVGTADYESLLLRLRKLTQSSANGEKKIPFYWVALHPIEKKVAGTIGIYSDHHPNDFWLDWFSVDPSLRGLGLGKQMLELATAEAKNMGVRELNLFTSTRQAESGAQKLYESLGFKEFLRKPETNPDGSLVLDQDGITPVFIIFRRKILH